MNMKKIAILALSLCMIAAIAVTGTIAYFTDTDSRTNVFTAGNVKIDQIEKDRTGADFEDGQKLFPIVGSAQNKDNNGYADAENYIDKIITVKNTGTEAAYIRTHIAFPAALDDGDPTFNAGMNILHWNGASATDESAAADQNMQNDWYWCKDQKTDWPTAAGGEWVFYQTKIDGVDYNVYVATHKGAVAADKTTAPTLLGVYLDKKVNYANGVYTYDGKDINFDLTDTKVIAVSEAVQAEGFTDAWTALDAAFGVPGDYNPFTSL